MSGEMDQLREERDGARLAGQLSGDQLLDAQRQRDDAEGERDKAHLTVNLLRIEVEAHKAIVAQLRGEIERLSEESTRLRERMELTVERHYVDAGRLLPCGHPIRCTERFSDCLEPLCGWCEDIAGERMGTKIALQFIGTEQQDEQQEAKEKIEQLKAAVAARSADVQMWLNDCLAAREERDKARAELALVQQYAPNTLTAIARLPGTDSPDDSPKNAG